MSSEDQGLDLDERRRSIPDIEPVTTFVEMPTEFLNAVYQHLSILDRINLHTLYPRQLADYPPYKWLEDTRRDTFVVSRRQMRMHGSFDGPAPMTEGQMIYAMERILPAIGLHINHLCLNYAGMERWPRAAAAMALLASEYCRQQCALHVVDASSHHKRQPHAMLVPYARHRRTMEFGDRDSDTENKDALVIDYLGDYAPMVNWMTVNRSVLSGHCLQKMSGLKHLRMWSCLTREHYWSEDGSETASELRPLYLADLAKGWCRTADVTHLDLRQERLVIADLEAILSMPRLTYLKVRVDNINNQQLNDLLLWVLSQDVLDFLSVSGDGIHMQHLIDEHTLDALERTEGLRELELFGVDVNPWLWNTLIRLEQERPWFKFRLN